MTLPPGLIPEHDITSPSSELPPLGESESLSGELGTRAEAPEGPRKRRGRPPRKSLGGGESKGPGAPEPTVGPSPEELGALAEAFGMTFDYGAKFMASRRGQHWLIDPEEKEILGQAWAAALAPYMGALAKYTPMFAAVVVTAGVLGPRVTEDARLAEEREKAAKSRMRKKDGDNAAGE